MDPCKMSLDEIINFRFRGNSARSGPRGGRGSRTDPNEAISTPRARHQARINFKNTSQKRTYEMAQSTSAYPRGPLQKIRLRSIDPMTHSLEDIIEEVEEVDDHKKDPVKPSTAALESKAESSVKQSLENDVTTGSEVPEYPEYTPYKAVAYLARKGAPVMISVGRLKNFECQRDWSHKWRCIISSGQLQVMADSRLKHVAKDMAAVDFLEQFAKMDNPCEIPKYAIAPEVFIDPRIFHMVEKAAIQRNLATANYIKVRPVKKLRRHGGIGADVDYLFVATVLVGNAAFSGENYVEEYAKLGTAKRAYEELTGREVPPVEYFTGDLCDPTLEYDFGESEISSLAFMKSEAVKIPTEVTRKPMRKNTRLGCPENFKKFKTSGEHVPAFKKPEP